MSGRGPRIQERLGCFGYFGFGGGWEMARRRRRVATHDGQAVGQASYCNACREREKCWKRHQARVRELFPDAMALFDENQARVRELFPDAMALFDEIAEQLADAGADAIMREWARRTGSDAAPPDLVVMGGNMEDGERVGRNQDPKDRERGTLTWPLVQLEPLQEEAPGP